MSKICDNCGQELSDNSIICDMCGEHLSVSSNNDNVGAQQQMHPANPNPPTPAAQPQSPYQYQYQPQPIQPHQQNIMASQIPQINSQSTRSIGMIVKIIAAVLAILFFLPMFTVSCSGEEIPFSGLDCAIGKDIGFGSKSESNAAAWFLVIVPLVFFVVLCLTKNEAAKYLAGTVLSCIGLIMFFIFYLRISEYENGGMVKISLTAAFFGSVILYIISGILCAVGFMAKKSWLKNQ